MNSEFQIDMQFIPRVFIGGYMCHIVSWESKGINSIPTDNQQGSIAKDFVNH